MFGFQLTRSEVMSRDYENDLKIRFPKDVEDHELEEVSGKTDPVGYWKARKPSTNHLWFDIIASPGMITIRGDMGTYSWSRTTDMVAFMLGSAASIGYATEKLVSECRVSGYKEFDPDLVGEWIKDSKKELVENRREGVWDKDQARKAYEELGEIEESFNTYGIESDFYTAVHDSTMWAGDDMPNLKRYSYQYLWCLKAVEWACGIIDQRAGMSQLQQRWSQSYIQGLKRSHERVTEQYEKRLMLEREGFSPDAVDEILKTHNTTPNQVAGKHGEKANGLLRNFKSKA